MAPTRVLLLTDSFLPHAGGSREYYFNIFKELAAIGACEATILTKKVPGWKEFDRLTCSPNFRIVRCFKPLGSWKYQELPRGIAPLLQAYVRVLRKAPAIVHAGDLYPQGVTALALKKTLGLPYVAYCHGEEVTQTDNYRFQPKVRNHIYHCADAIIANAEFAKQNLLRIGVPEGKICKVTPGVDFQRFHPAAPSKELVNRFGLANKTVLMTVSRLISRKGHELVIRAFAKVCREFPESHYLIVGTGPEEAALRHMVNETGLHDRVTFAGYVTAELLPEIYSLCDMMVMPNRHEPGGDVEGFGMVFLEASASGKPVIGGRTGGAIEAIAEGVSGYLVDPENPAELIERLRRLLADRSLREMLGEQGASRARAEFSWRSRAEIIDGIHRKILTAGRPRNDLESGQDSLHLLEQSRASNLATPDGKRI